jgi:hypothetical protein
MRMFVRGRNVTDQHRLVKTPEYYAWAHMIERCENPRNPQWSDYGGRGIAVCARWRARFQNFLADVGPRPSPQHSIDRLENNGNYEPGNVAWRTRAEQNRNTRRTILLTYGGETLCAKDWAKRLGLCSGQVITWRLKHGWSLEEALTTRGQGGA